MVRPPPLLAIALALASACTGCAVGPVNPGHARSENAAPTPGVIATVHPLASEAGADALRRGGNAVDAAVAAALTLGVVDGHNSGIGGGCFVLVRRADGTFLAIDGRETAPAKARRDMFVRGGKADPALSQTGALASGVPGSLAAYEHALRAAGTTTLPDLLAPAADLAERGFPIDPAYARKLKEAAPDLAKFGASAAVFLDGRGDPRPEGHVLRQPDLARTYRAVAEHGIGWFYGGPFAQALEEWMRRHGGALTARDFADYRVRLREPLVTTYRGYTVVGFPPPSSGGVHVAQILNVLEHFDLAGLERRDPALRRHVMAEAMKLAFADRAHWLGDPDFAQVPRGLADKTYARALAGRIYLDQATPVPAHGEPPEAGQNVFPGIEKHTTHIAAADALGNWVAITTTVNTAFGSKVVIPGTGVVMNNQMDDFSIQPGVPNAFGLVGAEANAVAPGKRPLSSMSPTVVLEGDPETGRPDLTVGAAGGPTIINTVVGVIVNRIDLGMTLPESLAAPRLHHQWRPDVLAVESATPDAVVAGLRSRGHEVQIRGHIGTGQAVGAGDEGELVGAHDPRVGGHTIAVR